MYHHPILIEGASLNFPHKTCFDNFTTQIAFGDRIAIIGRNGIGKTSLLQLIMGSREPNEGHILLPADVCLGYVPQVSQDYPALSGGQRFNKALSQALGTQPNFLILDEPTNHLDVQNRRSLTKLLEKYTGTLLVVSHDTEFLRGLFNKFWMIENEGIREFAGDYDHLKKDLSMAREKALFEYSDLERQRQENHKSLMREQERAKKSRARGEKHIDERKWPTIISKEKARRANETSGKKKGVLRDQKSEISEKLKSLRPPEVITPHFSLQHDAASHQMRLSIVNGAISYKTDPDNSILTSIHLTLGSVEKIALQGANGSGKTTFLKAILGDSDICREGEWQILAREKIGYLDQYYQNVSPEKSAFDLIKEAAPMWDDLQIRKHLNSFLLRKNEEVFIESAKLSGGEKVRLSLAIISANPPQILILDEVTNNLDIETKAHVLQVLQSYPGAIIKVSHDEEFLRQIEDVTYYEIRNTTLHKRRF
jgi:ATPase subunit of ABC transporter with duplicated ATPase domains